MSPRRAGQNVRNLATKRRFKAIYAFVLAGLLLLMPWVVLYGWQAFAIALVPSSVTPPPFPVSSPVLILMGVIPALGLMLQGLHLWKRAKHADQGALGEEAIAQSLAALTQLGWQMDYGLMLQGGLGDADIVCRSPKGRAYVIDVKSHAGYVTTDGTVLQRQIAGKTQAFEKDFIAQVMKQAMQIKKQQGIAFVTPIVAFSRAKVAVRGKIRGVYVVEKARLNQLLQQLDGSVDRPDDRPERQLPKPPKLKPPKLS